MANQYANFTGRCEGRVRFFLSAIDPTQHDWAVIDQTPHTIIVRHGSHGKVMALGAWVPDTDVVEWTHFEGHLANSFPTMDDMRLQFRASVPTVDGTGFYQSDDGTWYREYFPMGRHSSPRLDVPTLIAIDAHRGVHPEYAYALGSIVGSNRTINAVFFSALPVKTLKHMLAHIGEEGVKALVPNLNVNWLSNTSEAAA